MSLYVNFFLRANDNFIPLFSFSRNGYMYAAFHTVAPYEKISAITVDTLKSAREILLDQVDAYQRKVNEYQAEKLLIPGFDNSVDEKLDSLRNIDNMIADIQSELNELELAINYCTVMHDILETACFGEKPDKVSSYHENTLLYCGIEVGKASLEDVV